MNETILKRPDKVKFSGRILFLTEDISLIRRQLEATADEARAIEDELARRLATDDLPLLNNISTDEITPGWVCFYYDETLAQYVYVGMREGAVKKDQVRQGGFAVCPTTVSGTVTDVRDGVIHFAFPIVSIVGRKLTEPGGPHGATTIA